MTNHLRKAPLSLNFYLKLIQESVYFKHLIKIIKSKTENKCVGQISIARKGEQTLECAGLEMYSRKRRDIL